jgi:hypothetical protein
MKIPISRILSCLLLNGYLRVPINTVSQPNIRLSFPSLVSRPLLIIKFYKVSLTVTSIKFGIVLPRVLGYHIRILLEALL